MLVKLKESSIADFSERVTKLALLPYGCKVKFYHLKTAKPVRPTKVLRRKHVTARTFPCPADNVRVTAFLESVRALISTNLKARGIGMALLGPRKELFDGHTMLKTVRAVPGLPGPEAKNTFDLFMMVLENAGLGEQLSLLQTGALYRELDGALGSSFEEELEKKAASIRVRHKRGPAPG